MINKDNIDYYLHKEVSEILHLADAVIWELIKQGKIVSIKDHVICNGQVRYCRLMTKESVDKVFKERYNRKCSVCSNPVQSTSTRVNYCKNPECRETGYKLRIKSGRENTKRINEESKKTVRKKDLYISKEEFKCRISDILSDFDKEESCDILNRRSMAVIRYQAAKKRR